MGSVSGRWHRKACDKFFSIILRGTKVIKRWLHITYPGLYRTSPASLLERIELLRGAFSDIRPVIEITTVSKPSAFGSATKVS